MNRDQFQQILVDLMRQGLQITMFMEGDVVWFDLHTGMKSHLHVCHNDKLQVMEYRARYDQVGTITDMDDLLIVVRGCDYGRGFANSVWLAILGGRL